MTHHRSRGEAARLWSPSAGSGGGREPPGGHRSSRRAPPKPPHGAAAEGRALSSPPMPPPAAGPASSPAAATRRPPPPLLRRRLPPWLRRSEREDREQNERDDLWATAASPPGATRHLHPLCRWLDLQAAAAVPKVLIADDCYLSMPSPISSATSSATESPRPPHRLGPGSSSRRTPSAPPPAIR